jgi:DNA (cytosine-5)-methyltransferase 3A
MRNGINVVSTFDGMSCGQIALDVSKIKVKNYFASEIKPTAIKVTQYNYPKTIQIGSVEFVTSQMFGNNKIDLLIGGSPCKGISRLNQNQSGLKHNESRLFWEYVRLLEELRKVNPKIKFLLENTHGNKEATNIITETLGVKPISINSKLVSAQNRPRYYWTNIEGVTQPEDLGWTTKDMILDRFKTKSDTIDPKLIITEGRKKWLLSESGKKSVAKGYSRIDPFPKSGCLTANGHKKWNENYITYKDTFRYLSRQELEMLQTVPIGYTAPLTYEEAYDVLGDGWTVYVIAHILKNIN